VIRNPAKIHPFLHAATLMEKRVTALLRASGVRHRQGLILDALHRIGPTSQRHLAKEFDISPGSMSSMTDRLLALGFITRNTNTDDRRSDVLELTPNGLAMLTVVLDVWQGADESIETALGPTKAAQFFALAAELCSAQGGRAPQHEDA